MTSECNNKAEALNQETKGPKSSCVITCHQTENSFPDAPAEDLADATKKMLQVEVQQSRTPICTDINLFTSSFVKELKDKSAQVKELIMYTQGFIHDLRADTTSLNNINSIAKETKSRLENKKESSECKSFCGFCRFCQRLSYTESQQKDPYDEKPGSTCQE